MEKLINGELVTIEEVFKKYEKLLNKEVNSSIIKGSRSLRDDLYAEALTALKNAYLKYDDSKDVKFITYATTIIKNQLTDFNRRDRLIVPSKYAYYSKNDSEESDVPKCYASLDKEVDDEHSVSDFICSDTNDTNYNPEANYVQSKVRESVYNLEGLERDVALYKFGFTDRGVLKNTEIASLLNINTSEVGRLYNNVIAKLSTVLSAFQYN